MKVLETVYFEVPASDVERKDFLTVIKLAAITAVILIIISITII